MIIDVTISVCRLHLAFETYHSTRVSGDTSWVTTRKTRLIWGGFAVYGPDCSVKILPLSPPQKKPRATRYHWILSVQQVTNNFSAVLHKLFQKTLLLVMLEPAQVCCAISELQPVILGTGFKARRICYRQGITGFFVWGWISAVLAEKKLHVLFQMEAAMSSNNR